LFNYLLEIRDAWVNYDSASTFIWFGAGEEIKTTLGQFLQLQGEELNIFLQPAASYVKKMEIDLWRAALDDKTPLSVRAAQLRKKYWWLPFGYDGPQTWTDGYFSKKLKIYKKFSSDKIKLNIAKIRTEKIKDSRILIKKLQSSPYYWRLYSAFKEGARWTDERKKLISPLHYYYHVILKEISRRLDFPFLNLKYLTVEEILEIDKKKSYILKLSADRMNKVFMAVGKGGKVFFSNRKELIKYKKIIAIQPLRSVISGVVACRGPKLRYIAKVKILLSSQEYKKLRAGDFLVTSMTTPDFAIAMKKAAGLITDEGGATCHAAIMSREMGKPCIVATKISTKVFHDGDQVEVDTVEGTIKIMNKK
jgi:phosphohistidine swiveling domain-containing protein